MKKMRMKNGKKNSIPVRAAVLLFWIALWQGAAYLVHNKILLAGPAEVMMRLIEDLATLSFYQSVAGTLLRILAGFFSGLLAGVLCGSLAYRFSAVKTFLEPVVAVMKSIPVAAFVVLVLIWIGSKNLAVPISFFVVFPYIYISTCTGLAQTDEKLLEMADVLEMRKWNRAMMIYRPALMPHLLNAVKVTVGMAFKSGIAAEVIGIPEFSIGGELYLSKIYLDTTGVLAWTVVVIFVSFVCEKCIVLLLTLLGGCRLRVVCGKRKNGQMKLALAPMQKTYESGVTVQTPELALPEESRVGIMGPSGCGKTTWLSMILRTEDVHAACVFQEDRLCMEYSAVDNVRMTCTPDKRGEVRQALKRLLPEEALERPVSQLSGGMKRKTAVVRACLSGGNLLILDEPFTGMDVESREQAASFILEYAAGRSILFTTHQKEDLERLSAKCCIFQADEADRKGNENV